MQQRGPRHGTPRCARPQATPKISLNAMLNIDAELDKTLTNLQRIAEQQRRARARAQPQRARRCQRTALPAWRLLPCAQVSGSYGAGAGTE